MRDFIFSDGYFFKFLRTFLFAVLSMFIFTLLIIQIEDFSYGDAWWLALSSITTVGYGDLSASTGLGRMISVIFLYIPSLVLIGVVSGNIIEFFIEKRENKKMGKVSFENMQNHIVIVNVPDINTEKYLTMMKDQIDNSKNLKGKKVIILSDHYSGIGLPSSLRDWKYVDGVGLTKLDLLKTGFKFADYIFIFGVFVKCDSDTLMTLMNIKKIGTTARIISEYTDNEGKELLLENGCDNVIRQVRAYPELIVRTADIPGSEKIFENLFDFNGQSITVIPNQKEQTWKEICTEFITLEKGIPLGYNTDNDVILNPKHDITIGNGVSIFVML